VRLLPVPEGIGGRAFAVNNIGTVVGYTYDLGATDTQPAIWTNAGLQHLPTQSFTGGVAYSVNSQGTIAGSLNDYTGYLPQSQAVLWTQGQAILLGNFPGAQSWAPAVNDGGTALVNVGFADHSQLWTWSNGSLSQITSPAAASLTGSGINNLGHIAGVAMVSSGQSQPHAAPFLWNLDALTLLAQPADSEYTVATGLNDSDEIVGYAYNSVRGTYALMWQQGEAFDLNSLIPPNSGWKLELAQAIGSDGTITGYGTFNGQFAAFALTPVTSPSSPLPEPSTLTLLTLSTIPFLQHRGRRCR
jgi:uncharacterized membrane protein